MRLLLERTLRLDSQLGGPENELATVNKYIYFESMRRIGIVD